MHLTASAIAFCIASVAVAASLFVCKQLEVRYIHALAAQSPAPKLQGIALQKLAFDQPDLLVLYGSSELVQDLPTNASHFFEDYPSGFRVFPVGKPGTTSLAVLQKVASLGDTVRGRKLAYSISPGFFFTERIDPKYYEGNFSELQVGELAFSSHLSSELKRDVARRMLEFPRTLENRSILRFALERLASDTFIDRFLYAASRPLGLLQNLVGKAQDHFEAALAILDEYDQLDTSPKRGLRAPNWNEVLRRAGQFANAAQVQAKKNEAAKRKVPKASRDKAFLATVAHAREWTDLELLLRTFKELGAQPLLLTMPVEDVRLEVSGLSPSARDVLTSRLEALAEKYDLPLLNFRDHQHDAAFLADFSDHLSGEGWLYYNKALDDFYHGRITSL